jgi:hypothetical protein
MINKYNDSELDMDVLLIEKRASIKLERYSYGVNEISDFDSQNMLLIPRFHVYHDWTTDMKSSFIEKLMLNLAYQPMYWVELENGKFEIIDGLERINTVLEFNRNELILSNLKVFLDLEGMSMNQMPFDLQENFLWRRFNVILVDPLTSKDTKCEIMNLANRRFPK